VTTSIHTRIFSACTSSLIPLEQQNRVVTLYKPPRQEYPLRKVFLTSN